MDLTEGVNFVLVDDAEIRRLNRRHLRHDRTTDVLAFGRDPHDSLARQSPFGEVVISVDTARRQARAEGHSLLRELEILAIHGLLHLLGYRDHRARDRRRMWKETLRLLQIGGEA